jgi:hypothetical protein
MKKLCKQNKKFSKSQLDCKNMSHICKKCGLQSDCKKSLCKSKKI